MNFMYPVYIFFGNVLFWPLTTLLLPFRTMSRFLAFLASGIISAAVGIFILIPPQILLFAPYAYFVAGSLLAIVVAVSQGAHDDIPEFFYMLMSMALGCLVGLLLGLFIP